MAEKIIKKLLNSGGGKYVLIPAGWLKEGEETIGVEISKKEVKITHTPQRREKCN
jgi:hypothetical protein